MKTILLVDDEPLVVRFVSTIAKTLNYRIEAAKDGAEALWLYDLDPGIDAVVTDVRMPSMDGFELARQLRAKRVDLPILIISAYFEVDGKKPVDVDSSTGFHYLSKPFSGEQLAASLDLLFS